MNENHELLARILAAIDGAFWPFVPRTPDAGWTVAPAIDCRNLSASASLVASAIALATRATQHQVAREPATNPVTTSAGVRAIIMI